MNLKPVVMITGGSRGIGRGAALALAQSGHDIAISYARNEEAAREVEAAIRGMGQQCLALQADISQSGSWPDLLEGVRKAYGRIDLFVNNAGIAPRNRMDLLETTEESFDEVLDTNLRGPFFLGQLFARWMLELKAKHPELHPRMVFVSSISAYAASVNRGEYCISKAGLSMTAQLFAARLAAEGIPVFELRPGIIATDMTEKVKGKYDALIAEGLVPQRRWGLPEDIGKALVSIAAGTLDFSTGQVIEVGGGFSIRQL